MTGSLTGSITLLLALATIISLAIWLYMLAFRGGYWRSDQILPDQAAPFDGEWPPVIVLVPARNEADVIAQTMTNLLTQDYEGLFAVVLIDDGSDDQTAQIAQEAAARIGQSQRLTVIQADPLPSGWSGKLWALENGLAQTKDYADEARYVWLSDADIHHKSNVLRRLVAKAETEQRDAVSLMALLSCRGFWERLLIPPFIYYFQMLYPFSQVNDPNHAMAAAAGGCVLIRKDRLVDTGGFAPIKDALIDDCALGRQLKTSPGGRPGGVWLGLSRDAVSARPYRRLADIWAMVSRSAYSQLKHSPWALAGTLLGMVVTYMIPPAAVVLGPALGMPVLGFIGLAAWAVMAITLMPTLRFYRQPWWLAPLLPLSALFYTAMTFDSAVQYWRGRGGYWKGRIQDAQGRGKP